jgi:cytochrome c
MPKRAHLSALATIVAAVAASSCADGARAPLGRSAAAPSTELSAGDPANGERLAAARCRACHAFAAGDAGGAGPNLHGVFGRRAAGVDDFPYSPALRNADLVWDAPTLDRWLDSPRRLVPKTSMNAPGMSDPEERRDLIAYLAAEAR